MRHWLHRLISKWLDVCKACGGAGLYQTDPGVYKPCFRCSGTGRYEYFLRKDKA